MRFDRIALSRVEMSPARVGYGRESVFVRPGQVTGTMTEDKNTENFEPLPDLGRFEVNRKAGHESFHLEGESTRYDLQGFWQWMGSDLLSNVTRGILAKYIVACDLGCADGVRNEWAPFDFRTESGVTVEVKSAAYLQSWAQKDYSKISFNIRPTIAWDPETNTFTGGKRRQAQVYVFCLLDHRDKRTVDPMNLYQWRFFIVPTGRLDSNFGDRKQISLQALLSLDPLEARFGEIGDMIEMLMS